MEETTGLTWSAIPERPLNIAITDLGLNTVIGEQYDGSPMTLLDAIVNAAVQQMSKLEDYRGIWNGLRKRVDQIRDEEIRALVRTELDGVLTEEVRPTNTLGEYTGPATTLRSLIVAKAGDFFNKKESDGYRNTGLTGAQRVVAEAVDKALTKELAEAVAEEKTKVVAAVRAKAATLIAQAVKEGVGR